MKLNRPRIGLVLGGGAARGWAHIGVIRALAEQGIHPDIITGSSVGSIVGGTLAADRLDDFEEWVRKLSRIDIIRLVDARLANGGFLQGSVLMGALEGVIGNPEIEALHTPFGCVATELGTGREKWLRKGPLLAACRASIAMPGLFAPVKRKNRYLVDGGLVNPVPISLARSMGADIVIAVNLNNELIGHRFRNHTGTAPAENPLEPEPPASAIDGEEDDSESVRSWGNRFKAGMHMRMDTYLASFKRRELTNPGLFEVITGSIDIMQDRITRSRMVGEPPDIHITPAVRHIGLMEFERAAECIAAGTGAVQAKQVELDYLIEVLHQEGYSD